MSINLTATQVSLLLPSLLFLTKKFRPRFENRTLHHDSSKCGLELGYAMTGVYFILYIEHALEVLQYKCTLQLQWIGWR